MGKRVVKKRTTKKQVKANRTNSKKSTGPRTAEGKARVRQNAIRHGLRAEQVVVLGGPTAEDPAEFDSLLSDLLNDRQPAGAFERVLIERLAVSFWRLRRAYRFEARAIERANEPNPMSKMLEELSQLPPYEPGLQELPGVQSLEKLVRYELMIDRELLRTAVQLQRLQHARKLEERRADACDTGPATDAGGGATSATDLGGGATGSLSASALRAESRTGGQAASGTPAARSTRTSASSAESRSTATARPTRPWHTHAPLKSGGTRAPSARCHGCVSRALRPAIQRVTADTAVAHGTRAKPQWPNKAISQPSASGRTTSVQVATPARGCATALEQWSGIRAYRSRAVAYGVRRPTRLRERALVSPRSSSSWRQSGYGE